MRICNLIPGLKGFNLKFKVTLKLGVRILLNFLECCIRTRSLLSGKNQGTTGSCKAFNYI